MHSRGTYNQTQPVGRGSDVRVEVRRVPNRKSCAKGRFRRVMTRFCPLLLLLCSGLIGGTPDDADAGPREAREKIISTLERLTARARQHGDKTAAQCLAEIESLVSGTPHGDLDAIRRQLRTGYENDLANSDWMQLKPVLEESRTLAAGLSLMDRADGGMVLRIPEVLAAMRRLNAVRHACGLKPVRYDAKRSAGRVLHARYLAVNGFAKEQARGGLRAERKGDKQASAAGRKAAKSSTSRLGALDTNVEWMLWDVSERAALLDPDDKGIAMGMWAHESERVSCIAMSGNKVVLPADPREVVFPPSKAAGVPRVCPTGDPLKKKLAPDVESAGPWITLLSYRPGEQFTVTTAALRIPPGEVVPIRHFVEHDSGVDLPRPSDAILLLPLSELEAGVEYEVVLEGTAGGETFAKAWTFTTGP